MVLKSMIQFPLTAAAGVNLPLAELMEMAPVVADHVQHGEVAEIQQVMEGAGLPQEHWQEGVRQLAIGYAIGGRPDAFNDGQLERVAREVAVAPRLSTVPQVFRPEGLHQSAISPMADLATAIQRMEKISHPLTEEGKAFLEKAQALLSDPKTPIEDIQNILHQFPTVEAPQLHFFTDVFEGLPRGALFGMLTDLRVLQVTKGCSHHCTHCSYETDSHVQRMSYVTVLKIAEAFTKVRSSETDAAIEREFKQRGQEIIAELRSGIVNKKKITDHLLTYLGAKGTFDHGDLSASYFRHFWELALYGKRIMTDGRAGGSMEFDDEMRTISGFETSMETKRRRIGELIDAWIVSDENHVLLNGNDLKLKHGWRLDDFMANTEFKNRWDHVANSMHNYADSDPFDFRDPHIRDRNGNMADYGDVVRVMHDLGFRMEIVTAGWDRSDSVAKRSAEKIKELGISVEVSVHPYSAQVRRNPGRYRESLKEIIRILDPNIIYRAYGDEMVQLLRELYAELGIKGNYLDRVQSWGVSNVGRAKDLSRPTKDSSYSYHQGLTIEPNGDVGNSSGKTGEVIHTGYNIFSKFDEGSFVSILRESSRINEVVYFKQYAPREMTRDLLEKDDERKREPDYPEFYRRRHRIAIHLFRKDPLELVEFWSRLKEKYPDSTFIPNKEYLTLLESGRSFDQIPTGELPELRKLIMYEQAPREMTRDLLEKDDERKREPDYPEFYRRRREIMTHLAREDEPDLKRLWRELKEKYPDSTFIPNKEYLTLLEKSQ